MPRVARELVAQGRRKLVEAASALFREQGTGVSLSKITAQVGVTNGGFYGHFESKEALVHEATDQAFNDLQRRLADFSSLHEGEHGAARAALIEYYLSSPHRDDLATGCPASGFATDAARKQFGEATQRRYEQGVRDLVGWIMGPGSDHPEAPATALAAEGAAGHSEGAELTDDALTTLSTMVGALVLSRATAGSPLSERFLSAARTSLLDT